MPPDIPEEAVERSARALYEHGPHHPDEPEWDELPDELKDREDGNCKAEFREQAESALVGALYLTEEEKRALQHFTADGMEQAIKDREPFRPDEPILSARQKLEESLKGNSSNAV